MTEKKETERAYQRRLKVLVSAYACDPTLGSEPGMGANWVIQLSRHHDLWILTEESYTAPLAEFLANRPDLQDHINIIGIPRKRYGESFWSHFYYWTYLLWQRNAYRVALELYRQVDFDLVHQLNMIGYREPGYLWKLPLPFVWGPIGGHAQMPWRFLASLGMRGGMHYGVRNILNWIQMRASLRVRKAVRRADALIAATRADERAMRRIHKRTPILLNEQGTVPPGEYLQRRAWDGKRPLKLVWCGLFLARKALHLGLEAISRIRGDMPVELHIVGGGACETLWKKATTRLSLDSCCHWYGTIPRHEALRVIESSDVMLFTGLQEGTPATVMEAIQAGVPVICHDACGFGAVVNDTCGIKVPMISPARSVQGFADALLTLRQDPELLRRLSEGARTRAAELSWENKLHVMLNLYAEAVKTHSRLRAPCGGE